MLSRCLCGYVIAGIANDPLAEAARLTWFFRSWQCDLSRANQSILLEWEQAEKTLTADSVPNAGHPSRLKQI